MSELATSAAANPVKTAVLTEAMAGALQNTAQQKTEIEIGVRKDFNKKELALMSAISGAPVALIPGLLKSLSSKAINKSADDILSDAEKAIAGWKGLKAKHLPVLLPVDISAMDANDEIDYSIDDAIELLKNSTIFDQFITDCMNDFEQFSKRKVETNVKN